MQLGLVGLGKMGMNMAKRLLNGGHEVVAFDLDPKARAELQTVGGKTCERLEDLAQAMSGRRAIWLMVPAGEITEKTIQTLLPTLSAKDILIDGGNSFYKDSKRRHEWLATQGIEFLDAGTSGGIWGLEKGYCLMVGGNTEAFDFVTPVFTTLAPAKGLSHVGPAGAGHYVKMVHNGIEYAMMQAYAEGFELMAAAPGYDLDLQEIAALWNQGSVVRSWLLELLDSALSKDAKLDGLKAYVEDSGEGRWTVEAAIETAVPAPTITMALFERFRSRQDNSFSNRVLAALRNEFGGHAVKKS